jgi:anti-sigma regulatory factor (Ser/Thr protein kinase)
MRTAATRGGAAGRGTYANGSGAVTEASDGRAPAGATPAPPQAPTDTINLRFRGGPEAATLARRALGKLRGDIDPPLMETMRLLVTELVANSVRHTGSDSISLKVLVGRNAVLVEVSDSGPGFQHRPRRRGDALESGWGLFMVERLAHRWGVGRDGLATRVWFELLRG